MNHTCIPISWEWTVERLTRLPILFSFLFLPTVLHAHANMAQKGDADKIVSIFTCVSLWSSSILIFLLI